MPVPLRRRTFRPHSTRRNRRVDSAAELTYSAITAWVSVDRAAANCARARARGPLCRLGPLGCWRAVSWRSGIAQPRSGSQPPRTQSRGDLRSASLQALALEEPSPLPVRDESCTEVALPATPSRGGEIAVRRNGHRHCQREHQPDTATAAALGPVRSSPQCTRERLRRRDRHSGNLSPVRPRGQLDRAITYARSVTIAR